MSSSISSSKAFVLGFLGVIAFATTSFAAVTEYVIRERVIPNHNVYRYINLFKNSQATNAVFGDSHAAYGVTGIPGFVNLAYAGNNFKSISGKVRLYFADRRPGKVILQAGPHHFSRGFLNWRNDETAEFRTLLAGIPDYVPRMFIPLHRREIFQYWAEFLGGGDFEPRQRFLRDGSRPEEAEYLDEPLAVRVAAAKRTARILEPVDGFQSTDAAAEYRDIVAFLTGRGGEVCLVTFPVVSLVRDKIEKSANYQEAQLFFRQLATKQNVRYVDLLSYDIADAEFADPHHLNARGARHVSRILMDRCFASTRGAQ